MDPSLRVGDPRRHDAASPPPADEAGEPAAMRTMTDAEIDAFVAARGFGVLSLAEGNHAYGVPLFYGSREGIVYFRTRPGTKTHYLYATTQACLTISGARGPDDWASVQLLGRLERVDLHGASSLVGAVLADVPPPLPWSDEDERPDARQAERVTVFRMLPLRRTGRYSTPAQLSDRERGLGY